MFVIDHRYPHNITKIARSDGVSNAQVGNEVLSVGSENILPQRMKLSRISCLGHVLHIVNSRLSCRALSSVTPAE